MFAHCDDYIDDETQPECLRVFLDYARSPAHGAFREGPKPTLFATYRGKRVRVTMASRFGDVGITSDLGAEYGYKKRVAVADLRDFSATAEARKADLRVCDDCDFTTEEGDVTVCPDCRGSVG